MCYLLILPYVFLLARSEVEHYRELLNKSAM